MRSRGRSDENARIAISAAETPFLLGVSFRELKHCEQNDARDDVGRARATRHDSPFRTSATGVCTVWPSHRGPRSRAHRRASPRCADRLCNAGCFTSYNSAMLRGSSDAVPAARLFATRRRTNPRRLLHNPWSCKHEGRRHQAVRVGLTLTNGMQLSFTLYPEDVPVASRNVR